MLVIFLALILNVSAGIDGFFYSETHTRISHVSYQYDTEDLLALRYTSPQLLCGDVDPYSSHRLIDDEGWFSKAKRRIKRVPWKKTISSVFGGVKLVAEGIGAAAAVIGVVALLL